MDEIGQWIKNITRFFRSRKLALFLIVLIIIISFLGTIIPQQHIYSHTHFEEMREQSIFLDYMYMIGFTSIFTSWLFFGIMFVFFINTSFCTYDMCRNAVRRLKKRDNFKKKDFIVNLSNHTTFVLSDSTDTAQRKIISSLKKRHYVVKQDGNRIFAQKNRFGVLGTPAFHLCILLVLTAILYGGVGRMEGRMQLVEGQTLTEQHQDYFYVAEGPLFHEKHRNFDIRLEKVYPHYRDAKGKNRGLTSEIVIIENGKPVKRDMVYSNHLIVYKDVTFFQNEYGFAPLFLLKNESGAVISGSYIYAEDDGSGRYQAVFPVADTGLMAQITLYPNTSRRILEEGYDIPKDPQIYLELFEGEERVFDGVLGMNQMVVLGSYGPGSEIITLGFYDLKYWSIIAVVIDHGTPFIFGGFYLAVLSLLVMFFFSPRRIWATVETWEGGTVLYIGGRSDRYKSSFEDEFTSIITHIKEVT